MPVNRPAHVSHTRQLSSDNSGLGGFDPTDCAKPVRGETGPDTIELILPL